MAWCRTGDKPLPELTLIKMSGVILRHKDIFIVSNNPQPRTRWWVIELSSNRWQAITRIHWGEPHDGCSCNHRQSTIVSMAAAIPIRCNNGKRKMWPWRWLHHFDFSTDDGCTRWWRWLQYFGRVIFDPHTAGPLKTTMHIGCIIVVKCDTCKISGAYAHLDWTSTVGDIGNSRNL